MSASIFETTDVTSGDRLFRWSQTLAGLCGPLRVGGYRSDSIDGRIETLTVSRLKLGRILASAHRLSLKTDAADPDQHAVVKVILQLRGTSVFEQGSARVYVNAGDCLAYDVSRSHSIVSPVPTEHLVVVIPRDIAVNYDLYMSDSGLLRFSAHSGIGHVTRELVEASLSGECQFEGAGGEQISDLMLRSLRLSLQQAQSCAALTSRESLLRRAKACIDARLADPALEIDDIASELGCSKRYLHLAFAEDGISVSEYLWASRLEACRREIRKGLNSASLTELAFAWGFSSSSHFSRSFKRRFGVSPSAMLAQFQCEDI